VRLLGGRRLGLGLRSEGVGVGDRGVFRNGKGLRGLVDKYVEGFGRFVIVLRHCGQI
jgi:hypothetical protein